MKNKIEHTPGPWSFEVVTSGKDAIYARINARDSSIAGVGYNNPIVYKRKLPDIAEANARLIAAAPALKDVLERAIMNGEKDGPAAAMAVLNTAGRQALAMVHNAGAGGTASPKVSQVPAEVYNSNFGCKTCLWCECECKSGSKYEPQPDKGFATCGSYVYYD